MGRFDRKVRRHRARRPERHVVAYQPGFAPTAEYLEDAKRATHDALINTWGKKRRSGISWRIWDDQDHILRQIRRMEDFDMIDHSMAVDFLAYMTDNPDAVMVLASCDIVAPDHGAHR